MALLCCQCFQEKTTELQRIGFILEERPGRKVGGTTHLISFIMKPTLCFTKKNTFTCQISCDFDELWEVRRADIFTVIFPMKIIETQGSYTIYQNWVI